MKSSDQVNSSSTPSKSTVPPMYSKSDENDHNYPPPIDSLNQRKLGETENFDKKKKVLTERNEAVDLKFSENSEISNIDLKPSCIEDYETKLPYDPLTNYLSPRPRFLRYKPSRRREIFLRRVGEENPEMGGGFLRTVGEDSLSVSRTPSSEEEEEEEDEETEMKEKAKLEKESDGKSNPIDEEIEDEGEGDEEDRGWTVKELLKFLLVIACLVLCTAYITSMNTPTPSFEASGAFRSGFCPILNRTGESGSSLGVESLNANGSNVWHEEVTEAASNMNSEGLSQFVHHGDEGNIGFIEESKILNGENEDKAAYGDLVKLEYTEAEKIAGGTIDEEKAEDEGNGVEFSEITAEDDDDDHQQNGKEFEISNAIAEHDEDQQDELIVASKPSILNALDQENLLSDILTAGGNEYTSQMEAVEKEEAGDWEMIESNTGEAESSALEASKITILERITDGISSFVEDLDILKSELIELMHTETEPVLKAVLGLSVSSAILTSLVLSFQYKKKKDDKKEPAISVSIEPLLQSPVAKAEKIITKESPLRKPTCDVDRSNNEPIRSVDPFKTLSSSIHSRDEVESSKEIYHREAPTIQFLGEFVVGEISNSLKNKSGLKNRIIEVEDSNFPVSIEEKPVSKHMNSGPEQVLSEFSTTSSPSYRSFTTKKKSVKKEVGGDGEVKSIPTPVRRSTRIRNRIVSP